MFCGTLWCYTSPEGAATVWAALIGLIGAFAAIAGAVVVGLRQSKIMTRQSDIMSTQTGIAERVAEIEEMKLKSDLFDARFDVYHATREWIRFIIGEARPPRQGVNALPGEEEIIRTFVAEWDRSRFLFKPSVHAELQRLLTLSHQLHAHQQMQKSIQASGIDHVAAEFEIHTEFALVGEHVSAIFGDELVLTKSKEPLPKDISEDDPVQEDVG